MIRRASTVLLALCLAGNVATAQAETGAARFERATDAMVQGRHAQAADALISLADDLPKDPLADDALFTAGTLLEEKLADPARAVRIYQRLLEHYPNSRVSLAAKRRLERLRSVVHNDDDARALGAMNKILHADPPLAPEAAIAAMEALIEREPSWSGLDTAQLWLGEAYARAGRRADAQRSFETVADRWPDGEAGFEALRQAAAFSAVAGDYRHAHSLVDRMSAAGDPGRQQSLRATRELVDREQLRTQLYTASFALFAAALLVLGLLLTVAAGGLRAAARAAAKPPTEIWYMLPVAVVMVASATTAHDQIAPAVAIILTGGLAMSWLCGAVLRSADRARRWLLVVAPFSAVCGVVAACYIAVHRTRLVDLIVTTVKFGPDL